MSEICSITIGFDYVYTRSCSEHLTQLYFDEGRIRPVREYSMRIKTHYKFQCINLICFKPALLPEGCSVGDQINTLAVPT